MATHNTEQIGNIFFDFSEDSVVEQNTILSVYCVVHDHTTVLRLRIIPTEISVYTV